jgi:hypothetical protein
MFGGGRGGRGGRAEDENRLIDQWMRSGMIDSLIDRV